MGYKKNNCYSITLNWSLQQQFALVNPLMIERAINVHIKKWR